MLLFGSLSVILWRVVFVVLNCTKGHVRWLVNFPRLGRCWLQIWWTQVWTLGRIWLCFTGEILRWFIGRLFFSDEEFRLKAWAEHRRKHVCLSSSHVSLFCWTKGTHLCWFFVLTFRKQYKYSLFHIRVSTIFGLKFWYIYDLKKFVFV